MESLGLLQNHTGRPPKCCPMVAPSKHVLPLTPSFLLFSAIMVSVPDSSSPHLLTRPSKSTDSWPKNKNRIVPLPNGFGWKLVIKSGITPRGDDGEEPCWVYKELYLNGWYICLCCINITIFLTTSSWRCHHRRDSWAWLTRAVTSGLVQ